MRPARVALVVALLSVAAACGGDEPSASTSPTPTLSESPAPTSTATDLPTTGTTVQVIDNAYQPAELTVRVGTEVVWTYVGPTAPHSVTASDGSFNSNPDCDATAVNCMNDPSDSFRFMFTRAGRFTYACLVHGELMSGAIVVE